MQHDHTTCGTRTCARDDDRVGVVRPRAVGHLSGDGPWPSPGLPSATGAHGRPAGWLPPGGRQIRGMQRDWRTGLLWATGNVGSVGHVWAISTRTGAVVRDVTVPDSAFLNDLVVTSKAVWVTDSRVDRLTRIALTRRGAPTSAAPTFLPLRGEWPGGGPGTRANGIRVLSHRHLVLDHSTAGGLWDVNTRTGVVRAIPVRGVTLTGGDGLERRGSTLWVVRGTNG